MTTLRGVIWDMDGVLVDTGEFHFQSWMDTLPDYGIPFSRQIFNETFGMNNEGILKLLMGEDFDPRLITEISERKEASFRQAIRSRVKALPGAISLLDSIQAAGIHQAIASSAPEANIDAVVEDLDLKHYFSAIVSAAEMPGKPNPAVFIAAAGRLNAPAAQCVVIEDGIPGVEAAVRAGMKCIAVTTTHPASSLKSAHMIVNRLDELTLADLKALIFRSPEA